MDGGGFDYALHNSLGPFLERGGDDEYKSAIQHGRRQRRQAGFVARRKSDVAAFIDFAGKDTYAGKPDGNNSRHQPKHANEFFHSIAVDVEEK